MFRRVIIYLNMFTFLWVQSAFAMKQSDIETISQFMKNSELTKRSVPFKELYNKFGANLPPMIRTQMESFIKENPQYMIPKMEIKKINVKGEDQIQININAPEGSLIVTTQSSPTVFATVVGDYNGKPIKSELAVADFSDKSDSIQVARQVEENSRLKLLSAQQYKKLNHDDKNKYTKKIRTLSVAAESVQNALQKLESQNKSVFHHFYNEAVIGEAWALNGSCIVAGYVGQYNGQSFCQMPPSASNTCGSSAVTCNPDIYNPVCVQKQNGRIPIDATAQCNAKSNASDAIPVSTKAEDFDKQMAGLREKVSALQMECSGGDNSILSRHRQKKAGRDQEDTCRALQNRVEDINKLQCINFVGKIEGLKCKVDIVSADVPVTPKLEVAVATPALVVPAVETSENCKLLKSAQDKLSCAGNEVKQLDNCKTDSGKDVNYCVCDEEKFNGYTNGTPAPYFVSCVKKSADGKGEKGSSESKRYEKPWYEKAWNAVKVPVVTLLFGWLIYRAIKLSQPSSQPYSSPVNPPVAAPTPGGGYTPPGSGSQ